MSHGRSLSGQRVLSGRCRIMRIVCISNGLSVSAGASGLRSPGNGFGPRNCEARTRRIATGSVARSVATAKSMYQLEARQKPDNEPGVHP